MAVDTRLVYGVTGLRGSGKDYFLRQIWALSQPIEGIEEFNSSLFICGQPEDCDAAYNDLVASLYKPRRFAFADAIKVEEFDAFESDTGRSASDILEFNDALEPFEHSGRPPTREDKIAVFDVLKARPHWRQRLIDRGMAGRLENANKWVTPTLDAVAAWSTPGEVPCISDVRFPSEVAEGLRRFPGLKTIRVWAKGVPVADDPSETSMLGEKTDYVLLRDPAGEAPQTHEGLRELLAAFLADYPQYNTGSGLHVSSRTFVRDWQAVRL